MTTPENSIQTKSGRLYRWPPTGESFFSVTTILGALDKPGLPFWAANETAAFAIDNADSWLALARTGQRTAAHDLLKRAPWRKRDEAADIGTAVHDAVACASIGRPIPAPPGCEGHMAQFQDFLDKYKPEYELCEATVYNRTVGYAGTLDSIAVINGERFVIDYKTSNPNKRTGHGIYPEVALQLAAYAHAEFVGLPDGTEMPMPKVDGAAAVWIREDRWALVPVRIDPEVFRVFRYVIECFKWQNEIGKTVLGKAQNG